MRRLRYTLPVEGRPGQSALLVVVCLCAASASVHPSIRPRPSHRISSPNWWERALRPDPERLSSWARHPVHCETGDYAAVHVRGILVVLVSILLLPPALRLSGYLALRLSSSPALSSSPQILRAPSSSFSGSWTGRQKRTTKKTLDGRLPAHIADIRGYGRTRWDSGSAPCSSPRSRYSACFSSNP